MSIQEIIDLLAEVRTDLKMLKNSIELEDIKEYLKNCIISIDIIGCELTQNIAKKLSEIG